MAEELWNRVNIPFPSVVSSVRINFTSKTDLRVKKVLLENENVLKLTNSEILQTEVRVLYELLYVLNNSYRGNKTFKGLQQVEQCVNRLKNMKLVEALREMSDVCPTKIQRSVGVKTGECDVPSQPMLEWLCLKVLGAARLMKCTLHRCSRAFLLCSQQMKWEEFVILNIVITSLLSRLWVIFRGILVSLSTLYEKIFDLCGEVAKAKPMPFLTSFSLPPDMSELMDPAFLLNQTQKLQKHKEQTQTRNKFLESRLKNQQLNKMVKEDLGVAIERDLINNSDLQPFVNIFKTFTKETHWDQKDQNKCKVAKKKLKIGVREATSFRDLDIHLEKMIQWCKLKKMGKERRLFSNLKLKCQKMKGLETEGHNVQRKLESFRREVFTACSKGSLPRTHGSLAELRKTFHSRTNFHSLRSQLKSSMVRTGIKKKLKEKQRKSSLSGLSKSQRRLKDKERSRTADEVIPQSSHCDRRDDIDDIFASIGL